jgi:uncharacterized membrane protein YhhN
LSVFLPLILASAALTIYGKLAGRQRMVYAFKPLTTCLIILLAVSLPAQPDGRYRLAILIGLGCSLVGDILLILPGDRFVAGLASFLVALIAYLIAFTVKAPLAALPGPFVIYAAAAAPLVILLWPRLRPRIRAPVVTYAAVMATMAAQALTVALLSPSPPATAAAAGAALFVLSDSVLVVNRYIRSFRLSPLVILSTYYAAQTLIALSLSPVSP